VHYKTKAYLNIYTGTNVMCLPIFSSGAVTNSVSLFLSCSLLRIYVPKIKQRYIFSTHIEGAPYVLNYAEFPLQTMVSSAAVAVSMVMVVVVVVEDLYASFYDAVSIYNLRRQIANLLMDYELERIWKEEILT
jgi:hypothetical protein